MDEAHIVRVMDGWMSHSLSDGWMDESNVVGVMDRWMSHT